MPSEKDEKLIKAIFGAPEGGQPVRPRRVQVVNTPAHNGSPAKEKPAENKEKERDKSKHKAAGKKADA